MAIGSDSNYRKWRIGRVSLLLLAGLLIPLALRAQQPQGPLSLPSQLPANRVPPAPPAPAPQPSTPAGQTPKIPNIDHTSSPITHEPPSMPVGQIIQEFAAHEAEFRLERDNFTYTQTFVMQTIGDDGQPDGEYRMTSDITYPDGKRFEKITDAPQPTLTRVEISEEDLDDLRNIQPFVLTTDELPKYNITYVGRQRVDELHTYVFDVAPKKIEKNQRYFQGRIWVDAHDLEIVKTDGKAVPDITKGSYQNLFPEFETYRVNIEGHYWFPAYTHADDVLHFSSGDVHIRMSAWWYNYKRFRVSVKLLPAQPAPPAPPRK